MKKFEILTAAAATAALVLQLTACNAATSQSPADEADASASATADRNPTAEEAAGFLERLLEAELEPVVVPAGTHLTLTLDDTLSSHETPAGALFSARVTQEVSVDGRVAIPAGSVVRGRVTEARPANKVGGRAILSLSFDELQTPDGETATIAARLVQVGKSERAKDAAIIGGSTLGGAILGEAVDEGQGTVVGAIVGGIAGTVGALKTKGKPVELPAGTSIHIALESAVRVEAS